MEFSMIVLAGGKSSRMGRDKSDLLLGMDTFLNVQIRKGTELGIRDILVSGYRGEDCPVPVIRDRLEGRGPLGGLEACLRRAVHDKVLVLGVDIPLVPAAELRQLMGQSAGNREPVTILSHGGKEEPLIGVYEKSLADAMRKEVIRGRGSVFAFINHTGYDVFCSKAPEACFSNVNCEEDYTRLREENII